MLAAAEIIDLYQYYLPFYLEYAIFSFPILSQMLNLGYGTLLVYLCIQKMERWY